MRISPFSKLTILQILTVLISFFMGYADLKAEFRQENVDRIIGSIGRNLDQSWESKNFIKGYDLVSINIEDLKKTLAFGGKITSNPVKAFDSKIKAFQDELRIQWDEYCKAQERLEKLRGRAAKQAINDIVGEMINKLSLIRPGKLSFLEGAKDKNMKIIKEDFKELKSIEDAIKMIEKWKDMLKPLLHETNERRIKLLPILAKFESLSAGPLDGEYFGKFQGEYSGLIHYTIEGNKISGILQGSQEKNRIPQPTATFKGTLDPAGNVTANLDGLGDDSLFKGNLQGRIMEGKGGGSWTARFSNPQIQSKTGSWSATKKK